MYDVDDEGFLEDPAHWSRDFAMATAAGEGLVLGPQHWELIEETRRFYDAYGFAPSRRPLVKYITINLKPEKGKSQYPMTLFPPNPARHLPKVARLRKPKNCL